MDNLNKDELFMLAIEMDLPSLLKFCASNKRIYSLICKRNEIWNYRLDKDFPQYKDFNNISDSLEKYKLLYLLNTLKRKIVYPGTILELFNTRKLINLGYREEIPKEIGNLINLEILHMNYNRIRNIPKEIGNLINLKHLYLFDNLITDIPKEIGNLINLITLNLSTNSIKQIPKEIGNLINLENLEMNNNLIEEIPKEIGKLINLRQVDLRYNKIKKIPIEIENLTKVMIFSLKYNNIKSIPKRLKLQKQKQNIIF